MLQQKENIGQMHIQDNHTTHALRITIFSIESRIEELKQLIGSLEITAKQMKETLETMQDG